MVGLAVDWLKFATPLIFGVSSFVPQFLTRSYFNFFISGFSMVGLAVDWLKFATPLIFRLLVPPTVYIIYTYLL